MPKDELFLQNITIVLLFFLVALIVALVIASVFLRKIINHNSHLEMMEQNMKHQNEERIERFADLNEQLSQEPLKPGGAACAPPAVNECPQCEQACTEEATANATAIVDSAQALECKVEEVKNIERLTDEQLMAWIDQRMDELLLHTNPKVKLKDIATALGITQRRIFIALKTRPKDNTLAEYLTTKRLNTACTLLIENPLWTIDAVASEAGFGAVTTFRTVFRKRFGISPSQYRETKITSLS